MGSRNLEKEEVFQREVPKIILTCLLESAKSRTARDYISLSGLETLVNRHQAWKDRRYRRITAPEVVDILKPYVEEGLVHQATIYGATANSHVNGYQPNGERIRELRHMAQKGDERMEGYEARRLAGIHRAQQQGYRIYSSEEERCAYELSLQQEWRRPDGRSDNKAIAQELNRRFHNGEKVRTPLNITRTLYRYRQLLETGNESS